MTSATRLSIVVSLFVVGLAFTPSTGLAQDEPELGGLSSDFDLAFNSAYVWRGLTFTDGAVFQPSATVGLDNGFSFNVWGNLDIADDNDLDGEFQEVDLTLAYAIPGQSLVGVEVGWIEYLFPNEVGPGTRELYLSLGFDTALAPSVSLYYDFDEVEDFYASLGIELGGDVTPSLTWGLSLSAGMAGQDFAAAYGGSDAGLFDGNVSFALTYAGERLSIGGFVAYAESLDDDVLIKSAHPVDLYAGLSLSFNY